MNFQGLECELSWSPVNSFSFFPHLFLLSFGHNLHGLGGLIFILTSSHGPCINSPMRLSGGLMRSCTELSTNMCKLRSALRSLTQINKEVHCSEGKVDPVRIQAKNPFVFLWWAESTSPLDTCSHLWYNLDITLILLCLCILALP